MRLIDADALTEKCGDWYVEEGTEEGFIGTLGQLLSVQPETNCSEIPNNCPAADVVPVVRCKDCKFREEDAFCTGRGFPCQLVPDDGFCDKGKKQKLQYADEIWRRMR